jgi:hypothetical protein
VIWGVAEALDPVQSHQTKIHNLLEINLLSREHQKPVLYLAQMKYKQGLKRTSHIKEALMTLRLTTGTLVQAT